jgi:HlyD family secretion protein
VSVHFSALRGADDPGYVGSIRREEIRMPVRPLIAPALRIAGVSFALAAIAIWAPGVSDTGFILRAHAQSSKQDPLEEARKKVETLINHLRGKDMPDGIVKTNGRIEATEVDVAAKYPGRLAAVNVEEGDEVTAGQVVATISSPETEAQLKAAEAQVLKAKHALAEAEAMIAERQSDYAAAQNDLRRGQDLVDKGWMTKQIYEQRLNKAQATEALLHAAEKSRDEAQAAIVAAQADVQRLQSILVDLVLVAPRSGRVQYRLARAGEVVAAGQRVLTILDLKDVYMTIYLPAAMAGQLMLGDEARVIADPIPEYVLPATVSFVATDAQFTPKSVETAEERQKLMFRVKLQGDPKFLDQYHRFVKTGIRGLGFVRTDPKVTWPPELVVKLPPR